ncbi:MAG: hypothetical protein IT420_05260, partial [Candidatus Brocadia sp.]|nr:hypothetical protein [Candidatus Brocadia sp.]
MSCRKMLLSSFIVVFVSFVVSVFTAGATYGMNHSGVITGNETWYAADNPHIVTDSVGVDYGGTLTVEPGSLVKFDAGKELFVGYHGTGTLNAIGTSGNPITFTSSAASPAPGDWGRIVFYNGTDGSTILDYCTVEYGGNNIYCQNASPTI